MAILPRKAGGLHLCHAAGTRVCSVAVAQVATWLLSMAFAGRVFAHAKKRA